MSVDVSQLLAELDESISTHFIDKAITGINSISSKIQISDILSTDQDSVVQYFTNIYKHIIHLPSVSKQKSFISCLNSFQNHWNALISSLNPLSFLKICKQLYDSGLTEYLFLFITPAVRSVLQIEENSTYTEMIEKILEVVDIEQIVTIPSEIWHALVTALSIEQVEKLIDFYISKNKNEKGVLILASKERSKLYEKVFINATMDFICKFIISIPKKAHFDVLTISSRIAETIIIEGYNPEIAFDMIPFVVKGEPDEVEQSAFYPFWPSIIEYLQKKESVSALFALQSGYKAKLVKDSEIIQFLKLEEKTDLRYRLASFQISLEMIECEEIQPKLFNIIHDISMTRGNAMLCCLVDHLPTIFNTLVAHDEDYAYDIVNTIMNPIPYDQFLPPFILRFLNSNVVPNPRDSRFKFNVETVIYKYMNLSVNVTSEIKNLMKKIDMKIDMLKVDWFDLPLSNSVTLVDDVCPDLLLEIISCDTLHISFLPNIIDKLTQICVRDDRSGTFYNNKTTDTRHVFDITVSTLFKIVSLLGLHLDDELKKRNQKPFPIGATYMGDLYINGCIKFLSEPIAPSFLGAFIRSMVHLIVSLIAAENEREKLNSNLVPALLIVAKFISAFMVDQTLAILSKVKALVEDQDLEFFRQIEADAVNSSSLAHSRAVTEYLIAERGAEEAVKTSKEKALKAASIDFLIAKKLAPYLEQPLPEFRTFQAFEGVEKHAEWVQQCREHFDEDQWITAPANHTEKAQEKEEEEERNENENNEKVEDDEKSFKFDEEAKEAEKGIDGFLDGSKYSIISFLNFNSNRMKLASVSQSTSLEDIEEFAMKNSSDQRLVLGFFYYSLCHGYHTPKYNEWLKLITIDDTDLSLYTASLFLSSLVGKDKANLHLNLTYDETVNEPLNFTFDEFSEELKEFILNGLKTIGYYVISKQLLTFAFQHETSTRWFFIRSVISLDCDHFKDTALIYAEFTDKKQLTAVYKPFFDGFNASNSFEALISIFKSLTKIYFVPDQSLLIDTKHLPLVHDALHSLKLSVPYPPPITIEKEIIDSLLNALSRQKYFPITFFTFFSHSRLTDGQFNIVKDLLSPKTRSASNFFNYLLPSAYFSDTFPLDDQGNIATDSSSSPRKRRPSLDLEPEQLNQIVSFVDKDTAIHFSNKPPSFSRAFYRSLMLPFMPILPQKLIVEVKDLLCEVFPPFSYNALNMWPNLNDIDQIIFQKYPEDILEHFQVISCETIDIFKSVMNDPLFDKKGEVTDQLLRTSLKMESNVTFAVNVCDALISLDLDLNELFHRKEIVNSPQFCLFCVLYRRLLRKKVKVSENFTAEIKDLLHSEERKDLFSTMDQHETIYQIIHNLFSDNGESKVKWSKKHFFKP